MVTKIIKKRDIVKFRDEWFGMTQNHYQDAFRSHCDDLVGITQDPDTGALTVTFGDINKILLGPLVKFIKKPLCPEKDFLDEGYYHEEEFDDEITRSDIFVENVVWKVQWEDILRDFCFNVYMHKDMQTVKLSVVTFVLNYLHFRHCSSYAFVVQKCLEEGKLLDKCLAEADDYVAFCYKQALVPCSSAKQAFGDLLSNDVSPGIDEYFDT